MPIHLDQVDFRWKNDAGEILHCYLCWPKPCTNSDHLQFAHRFFRTVEEIQTMAANKTEAERQADDRKAAQAAQAAQQAQRAAQQADDEAEEDGPVRPAGVSAAAATSRAEQERDTRERQRQAQAQADIDEGDELEGQEIDRSGGLRMATVPNFRIVHNGVGIFTKGMVVTLAQLGGDISSLQRLIETGAIEPSDEEATPASRMKLLI